MRDEYPFVLWQVALLRWVRPLPSLLAIIGSWLICRTVLGRWNKRSNHVFSCYDRMMLGLSAADMLTSTRMLVAAMFLPLPFDRPSPSCTTYGFFLALGFSAPYYNAAMSLCFLVTICSRQKEKRIGWRTECALHLIAIGFPLVSAFVGLHLRVYNPDAADIGCFAVEYPVGCADDACIHGKHSTIYLYVVAVVPLMLIWVFLIGSNVAIYWHVRRLIHKTMRFTQAEQTHQLAVSSSMRSRPQNGRPQNESTIANPSVSKTRMVATQSILYVVAYLNCWVWSLALAIAETVDPEGFFTGRYFLFNVLESIFYPCQGFFNAFVYFRPSYMRVRATAEGRELSRLQCMRLAVFPQTSRNSAAQECV